jgi:hypothetical protein
MRTILIAIAAAMLSAPSFAERNDTEFGGSCAYGLAEYGVVVPTDCSITWTDPKAGKTYCFSSEDSKRKFLANVEENLRKAQAKAAEMHKM